MRILQFFMVLFTVFVLAVGVNAEEKKFSDEAELSYVDTGGNTDVTTLSAKNLLKYKFTEKLEGSWKAAVVYGEDDGEKNAESYLTEFRADYLFTERFYSAFIAGWEQDDFAGIHSRYYAGPAAGYKILTGPNHFLLGELGVTYVDEEYIDETEEEYMSGRAFVKYEYALTEKNKFSQSLEYLHDFEDNDNYNINSVTALVSALSDYLSLKISYEVNYDNKPVPSTLDDTDTILTVALVVNF